MKIRMAGLFGLLTVLVIAAMIDPIAAFSTLVVGMAVSDIETLLKEQYIDELPETFTKGTALCNELMKAPNIEANTRAVVFNLEVAPGGDFKGIDFDGGAYPLGNSMVTKKPTVSSIGVTLGFNVTSLMEFATKNNKLAVANVMDKTMADVQENMKLWLDCLLNAETNDGVLDMYSDIASAPTYVLNSADSPYGGYLLIPGGRYDIYDSTLVTERIGGPYRIDPDGGLNLTKSPPEVTFTSVITGDVNEDRIVAQDLVNASINPIWYHLSGSQSGTWQSLSRAKIYTRAQRVDGGSQKLDGPLLRSLLTQILKFSGDPRATQNLRPYFPYEQYRNYENAAQDISTIMIGGSSPNAVNKSYDLLLGEAKVEGRSLILSNHADPTKVGFFNVSKFRWIVTRKLGLEPNENGGKLHRIYDTTLGTPKASHSIYMNYMCNLGCVDPTQMGVIDTLALP